jgi:KDEL-tailed cysteine endopeptidase
VVDYESEFQAFKKRYSKNYSSPFDEKTHFATFLHNFDFIQETNSQDHAYKLEINEFADLTLDEFASARASPPSSHLHSLRGVPHLGVHRYSNVALPNSVDWHKDGAMTAVKNQGKCGSCWIFSALGAIEGAWYINTNRTQLLTLSEQQVLDCGSVPDGCSGGNSPIVFDDFKQKPLCTSGSYRYHATQGTCKEGCTVAIPAKGIRGYKTVEPLDPKALQEAVAKQPVAVSINANDAMQFYKGGVLTAPCPGFLSQLNHAVLLVGYGTDGKQDYWLIKNSWGPTWGENGYGRIQRGQRKGDPGQCGILEEPFYPVVDTGFALPSMNPLPIAQIVLVIGAIVFGICISLAFARCICKRCHPFGAREGPACVAPARPVVNANAGTSSLQNIQALAAAAGDRKGNSAASRLLAPSPNSAPNAARSPV